jgi:hypothetical protein
VIANNQRWISTFLVTFLFSALSALAAGLPISVRISSTFGVRSGDTISVSLLIQSQMQLGGIDFRVHHDPSLLKFVTAQQDTGIRRWEWFIDQYDSATATLRITSIADLPFPPYLDSADFYPKGSVARIKFAVLAAWPLDSAQFPVTFYWATCADNAGSNLAGDSLIVIRKLTAYDGELLWDETDNVHFPESIRPPNIGLLDSCQQVATKLLYRLDLQDGILANYVICGNADASSAVDISDAVYLVAYIFNSGPPPQPLLAGDVDCSGAIDISDVVALIGYIFSGGTAPCNCH